MTAVLCLHKETRHIVIIWEETDPEYFPSSRPRQQDVFSCSYLNLFSVCLHDKHMFIAWQRQICRKPVHWFIHSPTHPTHPPTYPPNQPPTLRPTHLKKKLEKNHSILHPPTHPSTLRPTHPLTHLAIHLISPHLSLNGKGCWGTTDDFTTNFLHFFLFSTALWDLANSSPVHSLMLSSHLFFCLPFLLPPFTVPCKMVLVKPDERETCPYHFGLRLFPMIRQ